MFTTLFLGKSASPFLRDTFANKNLNDDFTKATVALMSIYNANSLESVLLLVHRDVFFVCRRPTIFFFETIDHPGLTGETTANENIDALTKR